MPIAASSSWRPKPIHKALSALVVLYSRLTKDLIAVHSPHTSIWYLSWLRITAPIETKSFWTGHDRSRGHPRVRRLDRRSTVLIRTTRHHLKNSHVHLHTRHWCHGADHFECGRLSSSAECYQRRLACLIKQQGTTFCGDIMVSWFVCPLICATSPFWQLA